MYEVTLGRHGETPSAIGLSGSNRTEYVPRLLPDYYDLTASASCLQRSARETTSVLELFAVSAKADGGALDVKLSKVIVLSKRQGVSGRTSA